MNVHIDRACVMEPASGAQQLRNQPAEHDELRSFAIVMDDAHERFLCRFPCRPGTRR